MFTSLMLEMSFVRSTDNRKPITVRLQVTNDDTNEVVILTEMTEHEFAALLSGSVVKVQDQLS